MLARKIRALFIPNLRALTDCGRDKFTSGAAQTALDSSSDLGMPGGIWLLSERNWQKNRGTTVTKKIAVVAVLCAVVALVACRREEYRPLKLGGPVAEQPAR